METLLTNPDKPERNPLPGRENPLSYKHKLLSYGFKECSLEYSILHPIPPLLMADFNPDDLDARQDMEQTVGLPEPERWKLMFMCSIFGSRSIRQ